MAKSTNSKVATDIRSTDIVFDCPYCEKSLAIDYRGAGLVIACPDCSGKVQVPIPDGMEIADLDSSDEEQEIRIIQMRKLIGDAQKRVLELESELAEVRMGREALEQSKNDRTIRFETITREIETAQKALRRIVEVMESSQTERKKG